MLRVGLDLRATEPGFKAHYGRGTGRYASELVRLLPRLASSRAELSILTLTGEMLRGGKLERRLIDSLPAGRETVESQICLPRRLKRSGADIIHFFAHGDAPAWGGFPSVVTVLDLIPLKFRELYRAANENWRYHLARSLELGAIRKARGIIAISDATKRDVVEILNVPAEKIVVTPLAADLRFQPSSETAAGRESERRRIRGRLGLPQDIPLALYLGGIDPRKNVTFLFEVFREVINRAPELKAKLLIAGKHEGDKFYPQIQAKISELQLQPYILDLGFFPDELLPELYQASDLFLFPSLYEGFGLPVLEAISCATPVVSGRNSSMPELLGDDYMHLLPDNDKNRWVDSVLYLLSSSEARLEAAEMGLKRRKRFSWEQTAEGTLDAYEKFGLKPGGG